MTTIILASLFVLIILIGYESRKHSRMDEDAVKTFWEREVRANNTRRKPLDGLAYIEIPFERLPMDAMAENGQVAECHQVLRDLSAQKIVNLTGISNTDLKLEYGAPNINLLTQYDQNYTLLARTLQKWAGILYENGHAGEARAVLEFALSTKTDVSRSYYLLADIYRESGETEKLEAMIETARSLNSAMKNPIVRTLQQSGPHNY